jgi:hypothetical protein
MEEWDNEREREDDLFTCDAVLLRRQKGTERKNKFTHTHKRNYKKKKKKSPCVPLLGERAATFAVGLDSLA